MDKITIEFLALDQQRIRYWGSACGYCGTKPGMPVNFLPWCDLSDEEKADVILYVVEHVGPVKRTYQTKGAFDVIESRGNSAS